MDDKYKKVQCDFGKHLYYLQISYVSFLMQIYDKELFCVEEHIMYSLIKGFPILTPSCKFNLSLRSNLIICSSSKCGFQILSRSCLMYQFLIGWRPCLWCTNSWLGDVQLECFKSLYIFPLQHPSSTNNSSMVLFLSDVYACPIGMQLPI